MGGEVKINRKKIFIIILIASIAIVPLLYSYLSYLSVKVKNSDIDKFERGLYAAIDQQKPFDMRGITDFEWDKMFVFYPYTSKDEMEKVVGRRWTSRSYVGYLLEQTSLGEYPLDNESYNKLVFTRNGKIIFDVTLNRAYADFTKVAQVIDRVKAKFLVIDKNDIKQSDGVS